jgi:small subunit ribosomal protein S9
MAEDKNVNETDTPAADAPEASAAEASAAEASAAEAPGAEAPAVEAPAADVAVAEAPAEPKPVARTAPPLPAGVHYIWGTGRRKRAVARVRIRPGSGNILINKRDVPSYFPSLRDQNAAVAPLEATGMLKSWDIWANVGGGGTTGQADAVSLGLARAIAKAVPDLDSTLRDHGLLTRDARMVERKKPGQPGARRRFQFSKR